MITHRCEFTPSGEPTGPGVGDSDKRAWRDRHQCREIATHVVEPLVSDARHYCCGAHLSVFVGTGARVLNMKTFETRSIERERRQNLNIAEIYATDPDRWIMDLDHKIKSTLGATAVKKI